MKRKILNILFLSIFLPALQGCLAAAGAAALGGGTYYVGTKAGKREDERIKTQALIDIKREEDAKKAQDTAVDQTISTQINQNYMAGALSSNIAVYPEVRNGVVILHGRVPDAATAERAIEAAKKTPGVQRIISNLVIMNQPGAMQYGVAPQPVSQQQYQQAPLTQQQLQMIYQQQQMQQLQMQQPTQMMIPQYQPVGTQAPQSQQPSYIPIAPPVQKQSQYNNFTPVEKSQIAKQQPSEQKTSPPKQEANNKVNKPKLLPNEILENYSSKDNDTKYIEYVPPIIKNTPSPPPQSSDNSKQIIYVPVPIASEDNDVQYREKGSFNPSRAPKINLPSYNPVPSHNSNINNAPHPQMPVPIPAPTEDNDLEYTL